MFLDGDPTMESGPLEAVMELAETVLAVMESMEAAPIVADASGNATWAADKDTWPAASSCYCTATISCDGGQGIQSTTYINCGGGGVSGNVLTVEADVPDWKKMEEIASSTELSQQYKDKMTPTIKKNYNVSPSGETKFSADQLSEIKAGETVLVNSKESVIQTDNLTAVEIVSPYQSALPPGIQQ
jgi:hypothetical protein